MTSTTPPCTGAQSTRSRRATRARRRRSTCTGLRSAARDRGKLYRIGGDEVPPTEWQGRQWITFPRTWDNIRKNGRFPSEEEVEAHLKDVLGEPRPEIPINPTLPSKPQEYVWAPNLGQTDDSLLMTEAEWARKRLADVSPRSWFAEARGAVPPQAASGARKVSARVQTRQGAARRQHPGALGRADEQRRAKAERAVRLAADNLRRLRVKGAALSERRTRMRLKSRFTRLNKEMKARRHQLHMLNYMLRERARHWIQPSVGAQGELLPSKNLTPKLFETQSGGGGILAQAPQRGAQGAR